MVDKFSKLIKSVEDKVSPNGVTGFFEKVYYQAIIEQLKLSEKEGKIKIKNWESPDFNNKLKIIYDALTLNPKKSQFDILNNKISELFADKELTLFANEPKELALQMSKSILDNFDKSTELITTDKEKEILKLRNSKVEEGIRGIEFVIDFRKDITEVDKEFEKQFYTMLGSIKNPKHKLYYSALWDYATKKGTEFFNGTKVNNIIKIATQKENVTYRERKEFTNFLDNYSRIRFKVYTGKREKKVRRGKKTFIEQEADFQYFYLFELLKGTEKVLLDQERRIVQGKTLHKIYGKLPTDPRNIGAYIPRAIFQLDGNEGERIDLIFEIYRLANQRNLAKQLNGKYTSPDFSKKPIRYERSKWIKLAGLTETDNTNRTRANELLLRTFERCKELGLINDFPAEIPINDDDFIEIHLPDILKSEQLS